MDGTSVTLGDSQASSPVSECDRLRTVCCPTLPTASQRTQCVDYSNAFSEAYCKQLSHDLCGI